MVAVRVVTDSTADIPAELARELGITVVPLLVSFGNDVYRDGVDLTSDEFFARLASGPELPKTSQPPPSAIQEVYERLAGNDGIVSVHLSSKLSGTVNAATRASEQVHSRCRIEVVDSLSVSMGLGLCVLAAARAAKEGKRIDAVAEAARDVARRHTIVALMETLEYLRRGGRIGRAAAFLGSMLQIRPIITVADGEASPFARERTRTKAIDRMFEHCMSRDGISDVAIVHATTPEDAAFLAGRARERLPKARVYTARIGPVIGVYGGPGTLGMAVA